MNKLTLRQRRFLLLLHLIFASIMLGGQVVFVILALTASVTDNDSMLKACYSIMHLLADTSVRASTIVTTVTGILLSVLTSWGLFRYYWIIAKELLTLLSIVIGLIGIYQWTLRGVELTDSMGLNAWEASAFTVNHKLLWIGIVLQIVSLAAMFVLSVWKPGGQRRGYRKPLKGEKT